MINKSYPTDFNAGAADVADVAPEYRSQHNITPDPILTSPRETLAYVAALAIASAVAGVTFSGMGLLPATAAILSPIGEAITPSPPSFLVASTDPATTQPPSEALQKVPMGFRKEFLRARAEQKKNGTNVFRYIQKGNIRGLTDSEQNGIGPGHGKSSSALEAAIASESLRSWKQVRVEAFERALGNQSFNDFSSSINQLQRKAGLPKLTEPQLRNFMDISFWRAPEKGEPDMARETADSEYYQLPKLTPGVRASLIETKLNYQEQIVNEAVATYGLSERRLHNKLTVSQHLPEAEAKFVSNHLDAVRFARSEDKTQALLRFGSEPYMRPPDTTPGIPPTTIAPPDTPPVTFTPPVEPPFLVIPPGTPSVALTPPVAPPLLVTPPHTPSVTLTPLLLLPLILLPVVISSGTPPHTHKLSSTPPWNRSVVVMGPPVQVLPPVITERSGGGFPNTPPSPPTEDIPISSTENPPIYIRAPRPVPAPSSILGTVAAGAGLLAASVKARSNKKD